MYQMSPEYAELQSNQPNYRVICLVAQDLPRLRRNPRSLRA
jgi:hypothetical protein